MSSFDERPRAHGLVLGAAAAVALAACLGVGATTGISGFTASLNLDRPPLSHARPIVAPAGRPLARRVVLVIVDGLGDVGARRLPELDALRARGVGAVARSHFPTWSLPNYAAILTGVPPSWSGVRSNQFAGYVPVDALPSRVQAAGGKVAYIADVSPTLPTMMPGWDEVRLVPWKGALGPAAREVLAGAPALTVLLLDECDRTGHAFGGASHEYREAATRYDELLGLIWRELDPTRDALVVTADHGHVARGGHGGPEPEVVNVPLVLAGAGVRAGGRVEDAHLADVAPTVAALLGVPAPGHALGRTLVEALDVDAPGRAALAAADARRILQLQAEVAAPLAHAAAAAGRLANLRGLLVFASMTVLVAVLVGLARARAMVVDRTVLAAGAAAFIGLVATVRIAFADFCASPSIPGAGEPVFRGVVVGLAVAAVQLVAARHAGLRRPTLAGRLRAGIGVGALGLLFAAGAAGLSFAFGGEPLALRFFGPGVVVLLPAMSMVSLYQAGAAALVILGEVFVYAARASHPPRDAISPRRSAFSCSGFQKLNAEG